MIIWADLTDTEVRLGVRIAEGQQDQGSLDFYEGRIGFGKHIEQIALVRVARAEYRRRLAARRAAR